MSMAKCHDCKEPFDTDDDPDCWLELKYAEVPICERCRDRRDEEANYGPEGA